MSLAVFLSLAFLVALAALSLQYGSIALMLHQIFTLGNLIYKVLPKMINIKSNLEIEVQKS